MKKMKNMKKKMKKMKKMRKIAIFHFLENCNFPRVFFSFFVHLFIIFLSFLLPVMELMKNDKK